MHHLEGGFHIRAVILAAGRGTRLKPLTDEIPKALVYCAGMTLLGRLIQNLKDAAPIEINIGVGWNSSVIRDYVETHFPDSHINIINVPDYEIGPLETLVTAVGDVNEPTIICPVDFVAETGFFQEMINTHLSESGRILTIAMDTSKGKGTALSATDSGKLLGINDNHLESAITGQSAMVLIAEPSFIDACRSGRDHGRTRVKEIISDTLTKGDTIQTWNVDKIWFDLDMISDVLQANRTLLSKEIPDIRGIYVPEGDTIETGEKLSLDSGIQLDKGVTICGPSTIASNSIIGPDSEIGPFVSVGQGIEVQGGCFISDAILFGRTIVSSNTRLSRVIVFNNRVFTE
ncbi:MAG: NTP transferase domain-containing protein [Candidatus Thorarchaeota archaeon]